MQKKILGIKVARIEITAPTTEVSKISGTKSFDQMFTPLRSSKTPPGSGLTVTTWQPDKLPLRILAVFAV